MTLKLPCVLALLVAAQALAQPVNGQDISAINSDWQKGGTFDGFKPQQEVLERRTRYAKHFRNANGTFTVQTGNVYHYQDAQEAWQDIDLTLMPINKDGIGYGNYKNDIHALFPEKPAVMPVELVTPENTIFNWWSNPELIFDNGSSSHVVKPQASAGVASGQKLTYPMMYDGVSEEFEVLKTGIENNTILHSLTSEMAQLPAGGRLQLRQFIPLKAGWKIEANGHVQTSNFNTAEFHVLIPGTENGIYFSPVIAFDHQLSRGEALYLQQAPAAKLSAGENARKSQLTLRCTYDIQFVAGGINVTTNVPAAWLQASGRTFPVTIDPTVTVTPPSSSGSYYGPMSHWYGYQRHADIYLASELGVSNVNISNIEYQRMSVAGTNAVKPAKVFMRTTTAATVTSTGAWNSTSYTGGLTPLYDGSLDFHGTTAGWKMFTFTTPFNYTGDNLMVMVYDAYGSTGSFKEMNMNTSFATDRQAYSRQDNNDPTDAVAMQLESKLMEIRITYAAAAAPPCVATPVSPANGATNICSGTTVLRWNKAAGATGYDVYLNTGTTAATLVSTNQADTFFNAATVVGPYAWRIIPRNSSGSAAGCNTFTFTTIQGITPTAAITVSPNDTLCPQTPATFTATTTDGGTAPTYAWRKNNQPVGTNSPTYTTNTLVTGDAVNVIITSNSTGCLSTTTATSNTINMVIQAAPVSVITVTGAAKFCLGGSATLSVPAGALSYQWANSSGAIVGATGNTYVARFTDRYTVVAIGGGGGCRSVADSVRITAFPLPVPTLSVNGQTLTVPNYFPTYQWYKNNVAIPGATTNSYTYTADGVYQVEVNDTNSCIGRSFAFPVTALGVGSLNSAAYKVYPNPSGSMVYINGPSLVNVAIRSVDGKLVIDQRHTAAFDISPLSAGVYLLYLTDDKGQLISVQKLVRQE